MTMIFPINKSGQEVGQIFIDLRQTGTFMWKEAVIITDDNVGQYLFHIYTECWGKHLPTHPNVGEKVKFAELPRRRCEFVR